jgi:AraC family transcriptional regulator
MEPKIGMREAFTVLGLLERMGPEEGDYEGIWKRYMAYYPQIAHLSLDGGHYGLNYERAAGEMEYLAGIAVPEDVEVPEGLTLRTVPKRHYAVFHCTVDTIHETYASIFGTWLPQSGYHLASPCFEYYPPRTESGEASITIYVALAEQPMAGLGRRG